MEFAMKVKDAMHKGAFWVGPDTPITDIARLMQKNNNRRSPDWGERQADGDGD